MKNVWTIAIVGTALALAAGFAWRRWRMAQQAAARTLARLDFPDQSESLGVLFCKAAEASGKPRGLHWKACELHDDALFAIDRVNGELFAMVGATIHFEAVAGGAMEDVEAVSNLRYATTLFVHRQGRWSTDGLVLFNLEPTQALERHSEQLQLLDDEYKL